MSKLFFASDLHGCLDATTKVLELFAQSGADQLILLGDLLNHGPRNPVPKGYAPADVATALNQFKHQIIAIRGNCDSEVDQMLCEFPMMADYAWLMLEHKGGLKRFFLTHGHKYQANKDKLSAGASLAPIFTGDVLCHGHTHIPQASWVNGIFVFNPGSTTIAREDYAPSYGVYQDGVFEICDLNTKERMFRAELG